MYFSNAKMEWLHFEQVCFFPNSSIGHLCEDLNAIIGQGTFYGTFEIQNTKWLWFVRNMVTAINNDNCGCFGLYPSFVARILKTSKQIHFFVVCNKQFDYEYYIKNCIGDRNCFVSYKSDSGYFYELSPQCETIFIMFNERVYHEQLPSEFIFAQIILNKIRLGCLTYGIVRVKGRATIITNEVQSLMHDFTYNLYVCEFYSPIKLANCKVYSQYCPLHPNNTCPYHILFHSYKSHRTSPYINCLCELCVKNKTPSLKPLCK